MENRQVAIVVVGSSHRDALGKATGKASRKLAKKKTAAWRSPLRYEVSL